jgi:hypothetical protein
MIAYDRLSTIIPADLALANKALAVAMQQIGGIPNTDLPTLASAVSAVKTTKNLPAMTQQTTPISQGTQDYYETNNGLGKGTGPCGTILTVDCLGTAIGWVIAGNLNSTVTAINSMSTADLQSGYQNVINAMNGVYDYHIPNPAYDPMLPPGPGNEQYLGWACIVPGGPGAGDYRIYGSPEGARNAAISAIITAINTVTIPGLQSTYPTQTALMNTNSANICQQMGNEQDLQYRSGLRFSDNFANLRAGSQPAVFSFIFGLPSYGQQTGQGEAAQFLEALADYNPFTGTITFGSATITAVSTFSGITMTGNNVSGNGIVASTTVTNINTVAKTITMNTAATASVASGNIVYGNIGGQAIIAVMRQGTNQTALGDSGILTNSNVPLGTPIPLPEANLIPSVYTETQAQDTVIPTVN